MRSFAVVTLVVTLLVVSSKAEKDTVSLRVPSLAVSAHGSSAAVPSRHARGTTAYACNTPSLLTTAQQAEALTAHNKLRGQEPAANMLSLSTNLQLANAAQGWANQCIWEHGGLVDCNGNSMGQNLYVSSNTAGYPALNMTNVCVLWDNERNSWSFSTATCATGQICGHWTQLVAARSAQVGCAYANCPTMVVAGVTWTNALFVVCDYSPPGNVVGDPIYLPGTPCSQCDSDQTGAGYKCVSNLCVSCTPNTDSACKCGVTQTCQNGGSWSSATCACVCPKQFFGLNCERACSCADAMPDDCPGWSSMCPDPSYKDFLSTNCVTTCNFPCQLPPSCSS